MGRLILSFRSGRQCPAIFIENFIEKDKCNHIAPVPAQLSPHSLIFERSSRRATTVFESGWNYFVSSGRRR
jgi:hypothetical protein